MNNRLKTLALTSCAVIALATAAHAQDTAKFDIAGGDLKTALQTFATQTSQEVLFSTDIVAGRRTKGVSAETDPQSALVALLDGTGLTYQRTPTGTLLVVRASDPQSGSAAGDGADAGTVQALIVTAQKREENIQDVPIAMSAFSQEDLTRSQVAGGPDLMTQVPNFTFTKTNFSGYSIQIRGIGTQAISATVDPAVAVAFNNTPFIRNRFFEQEFYDLERVEVLRGPQGTLYGRNATAGVVNIISAKPNLSHFEAKLSGDVANYNSMRLEGMINLPLAEDKAALRIAGAWTKRDGFVTNTLTGQQTDGRNLWSGRVSLRVEPTDGIRGNLTYEHFSENDDRLRSGKQLCHRDPGPSEINGYSIYPTGDPVFAGTLAEVYWTQGCLPASLYSSDSFQTPNGFALPYAAAAGLVGAPVRYNADPYVSSTQSRNLREIETRIKPEYTAKSDIAELQLQFDLPGTLTLTSETGFNFDRVFSFEDFNRFNTKPGIFDPGLTADGTDVVCDPQLGCSDRLMVGDLSSAKTQQFSQELRLSSNYEGRFNFSLGANFLRFDGEDKYYVLINSIGAIFDSGTHCYEALGIPGDPYCNSASDRGGYSYSNTALAYPLSVYYHDTNDIHHLNDLGKNYFLSKNPYHLISYAVFGETYINVTDNIKITTGLRWTVDKKTAPQIPSWLLADESWGTPTRKVIEQEWKKPTGRLAVDWKPNLSFTDETLVYGSYVRGYKAGGANPPGYILISVPLGCPDCGYDLDKLVTESLTHPETFKPEYVDAYEVGTKNTLQDGRLIFNVNAFYYDYTGYQISQIVDRSAVNLNFDAKIWGAELVADWRPLENLRLGFKGGYENTRMADGSKAIDLMDRTAGMPGWILHKPFPTFASSCIVPVDSTSTPAPADKTFNGFACQAYIAGLSPNTDAPNNGEGFSKDLSGNSLPNAPHFTATLTGDFTLPLANDWLMTLHSDIYYQSEAWTRIFNTPGYDKLKAYNNINIAAIFTNEDRGWTVMAYIKNLQNKDNITGAFLNSDDTGLTTNVFLNEPRLYGIRVTKAWTGSDRWGGILNAGGYHPFQVELSGDYGRISGGKEILVPATVALFPADHPYPLGGQNELDSIGAGGIKFTYKPQPNGWSVSAGVRYGRALANTEEHPKWAVRGGYQLHGDSDTPEKYFNPSTVNMYNYATTTSTNEESHTVADFDVGRDVGLGSIPMLANSKINFGVRYMKLRSTSEATLHGRPDTYFPPEDVLKYGAHFHRFHGTLDASRSFEGAGPAVSWDGSMKLVGDEAANGQVDVDLGLGGAVLFGRQKAVTSGNVHGDYQVAFLAAFRPPLGHGPRYTASYYDQSFGDNRTKTVTVPGLSANLGLSYSTGGFKLSGGYRVERYFDAIDGGITERKTYDRQYDGPYFKVSFGFGG